MIPYRPTPERIAQADRERNPNAKLSAYDVVAICDQLDAGHTNTDIAKRYGLVQTQVSHIRLGKQWSHLTRRSGRFKSFKHIEAAGLRVVIEDRLRAGACVSDIARDNGTSEAHVYRIARKMTGHQIGHTRPRSTLPDDTVRAILAAVTAGRRVAEVAAEFRTPIGTVYKIARGSRYSRITGRKPEPCPNGSGWRIGIKGINYLRSVPGAT